MLSRGRIVWSRTKQLFDALWCITERLMRWQCLSQKPVPKRIKCCNILQQKIMKYPKSCSFLGEVSHACWQSGLKRMSKNIMVVNEYFDEIFWLWWSQSWLWSQCSSCSYRYNCCVLLPVCQKQNVNAFRFTFRCRTHQAQSLKRSQTFSHIESKYVCDQLELWAWV